MKYVRRYQEGCLTEEVSMGIRKRKELDAAGDVEDDFDTQRDDDEQADIDDERLFWGSNDDRED
jgi:hypothetical protein